MARKSSVQKELRGLCRTIKRQNPDVTLEYGSKKLVIRRRGAVIGSMPLTPGGSRWRENLTADLRRLGLM